MFELEDDEAVYCMSCGTTMKEIELCKSRSNCYYECIGNFKKRCHTITCKDCEYCVSCEDQIQKYKNELKRNRYGKKNEDKEICKYFIKRLKDYYDIDF